MHLLPLKKAFLHKDSLYMIEISSNYLPASQLNDGLLYKARSLKNAIESKYAEMYVWNERPTINDFRNSNVASMYSLGVSGIKHKSINIRIDKIPNSQMYKVVCKIVDTDFDNRMDEEKKKAELQIEKVNPL